MVHVFNDDFLMTQASSEESFSFCCASEADQRLAALAEMVGTGQTLTKSGANADRTEPQFEEPVLEYDLEAELARALDPSLAESAPAVETLPAPEMPTPEVSAGDMPSMEFGSIVTDEMERALAEAQAQAQEVDSIAMAQPAATFTEDAVAALEAAIAAPEVSAIEPLNVAPATEELIAVPLQDDDEFASELERLLSEPDPSFDEMTDIPELPIELAPQAPLLTEPAEPTAPAPIMPVFSPDSDSAHVHHGAVEDVRDYSDPAAEFQSFFEEPMTASVAPEPAQAPVHSPIQTAATEAAPEAVSPIDAVLGASAALGAAAAFSARGGEAQSLPDDIEHTLTAELDVAMMQEVPSTIPTHAAHIEPEVAVHAPEFEPSVQMQAEDEFSVPPAAIHSNQRSKRNGGKRVAFVVMAIALLGGSAALALNYVGDTGGEAPTLLADSTKVKVKPKKPGGKVVPNQDQTVYKTVQGGAAKKPVQAKLKDSTEKPIKVTTAKKMEPRVAVSNTQSAEGAILKPRSVRTVVVKPDGTIVSSTAQAAKTVNSALRATTPATQPSTVKTVAVKPATATQPVQVAKLQPAVKPKPIVAKTIKVAPRIVKPAVVKPKVIKTVKPIKVAAKPAPKKVENSALPSVSSPYAVQISSRRTPDAAKSAWAKLSKRYASVLRKEKVDIRRFDITGKGTYYRVRVAASSKAKAQKLCQRLKSKGGDCFVTR